MVKVVCVLVTLAIAVGRAEADDPNKFSAIGVVMKMMQNTADKITAAEEAENKTYREFSWFCKDTSEEKGTAIQEGQVTIEGLEADINKKTLDVEEAATTIIQLEEEIPGIETHIDEAAANRTADVAEYKKSNAEVEAAVVALEKAIKEMKVSEMKVSDKDHSFLQTSSWGKTVKAAVLLGGNLGLKSAAQAAKVVNADSGDETSFDSVVGMLEDLQEQFRSQNQAEDLAEAKAEAAFKFSDQALKSQLKAKKHELMKTKQRKASSEADIGNAKQELAELSSTLEDDTKYLSELNMMCNQKEATFLQRTALRAEELDTIEEAKRIMQEIMAPAPKGDKAAAAGLVSVRSEAAVQPEVLAEVKAIQHQKGPPAMGFLQRREGHKASRQSRPAAAMEQDVPEPKRNRAKLVELLSSSATKLRSSSLTLLATRARDDPFKIVKQLIEGLITKLQDQASEAQSKKMYCDKEIGDAELQRDQASGKVMELNLALEKLEARRDQLTQDINTLTESLSSLAKQLEQAKALRGEEADEAKAEVEEAEVAISAVERAIQVMSQFYSRSKGAEVEKAEALLQQPSADAPDAGFKDGEAYKGDQGSSTGIIGTLESIKDEFKRAISETNELEGEAIKEHKQLSQDIATTISKKTKSKEIQSRFKTQALDEISDKASALELQTSTLKSALTELAALEEECGIGASYEERKKARAEEMQALKNAIGVLDEMLAR
eukprot:TRINITY_DN27986_c0_g1_i1.p1 TRINITY_DN27986_c0_g1~~TRINITY_DN27986_c0_g1_i1.p1  ORF type:complete len:721 (+),score=233.09 TRINITY_DN27986_c0_g1_i1:82-2244(+)